MRILDQRGEDFRVKRKLFFSLWTVILLAGVACGKAKEDDFIVIEEEPIVEEIVAPAPPPTKPVITEVVVGDRAPLTGMPTDIDLDTRIAMVIIENHNQARPQTGLDKADMVYEFLAEGGITRFAAFYQSEYPDLIGPVRSIRPYFLRLSEGFNAWIVHAGWSPEAESIILKEKLPSINGLTWEPKYFWRDKSRYAPHNMYTNFTEIKAAAEKLKFRANADAPKFSFKHTKDKPKGEVATEIEIKYNSSYRVGYVYDADKDLYTRSMNDKVHVDRETEAPLTATNIFVVLTKHKVLDNVGRLSVDITSGGEGYLFQKGTVQPITWKNEDGVIQPFLEGKQLALFPGKTWINVVTDTAPGITYK